MSGVRNSVSNIFLMPSIRKTKSAKQKKDELYQFIMEEGRLALKPCDYCVRNGHECKMATEKSGKCGQCAKGDGRQRCNAIPCEMFFPMFL